MRIQQLHDGIYLLHGEIGGRPLYLPLLVGAHRSLLIDTGCAPDVRGLILPALRKIGLSPSKLSFILNTHCDNDHTGGNHLLKKSAPRALLMCGEADREQIESPAKLLKLRYDVYREKHDHYYSRATAKQIRALAGTKQLVDVTLSGGERLRLADDWELRILHLPGHSKGHLGVLDLKNNVLFGGDAIHGSGYLSLQGRPALCPTYLCIADYLATIKLIESLPINEYCGCHWPIKRGKKEIRAFCQESRAFVEKAERLLIEVLKQPKTLNELCDEAGARLGDWPAPVRSELCYALAGHLDDLESRGVIRQVKGSWPARYRLSTIHHV